MPTATRTIRRTPVPDIIKVTSDRHLLGAHPGHHNGLDPVFALAAIHLLQIDLVFPQEIIPVLMRGI